MAALTDALSAVKPSERPQLLAWIAGRSLLGLARETGFREAAQAAYCFADILAGSAR